MNFFQNTLYYFKDTFITASFLAILAFIALGVLYCILKFDNFETQDKIASEKISELENSQKATSDSIQKLKSKNELIYRDIEKLEDFSNARESKIVILDNETSRLFQNTRAVHACFLTHDFARAAETVCAEDGIKYYCKIWKTYEESCLTFDKSGNWVLSPNPGVYNHLMNLYKSYRY